MERIQLCLLDCSSIQRYVFGSNKLKTNIGASHVVAKIFNDWIPETLLEIFDQTSDFEFHQWRLQPDIIALKHKNHLLMETGYIGGGNALLLFRLKSDNDVARTFVCAWTKKLLLKAPGLKPTVAIVEADLDDMKEGIDRAFEQLTVNKNSFIPATILPRHGITAECKLSGLSAEKLEKIDTDERWISSVTATKLNYFDQANQSLAGKFGTILKDPDGNDYEFSSDIENLGQSRHLENHVAIVHIDGNSLGREFKSCKSLPERRWLSIKVDEATNQAMAQTLTVLIQRLPQLNEKMLEWRQSRTRKRLIPVRPIILNGDDITFVCDSRLGFFLAETFMTAFKRTIEIKLLPVGKTTLPATETVQRYVPLSSCAGVAIIKTKYPFYRGYRLAEELCGQAKKKGRPTGTSWLDFHISRRGLSGSLTQTRKSYQVGTNSLLWRPWQIDRDGTMTSFGELKQAIREFSCADIDRRWPMTKIQALALALSQGQVKTEEFIKIMQARGLVLPTIGPTTVNKTGWLPVDGVQCTPYYDIIEALEFYPEFLLGT